MGRPTLLVALVVLCACAGPTPTASQNSPRPSSTACTLSELASASWAGPDLPAANTSTVSATVSGDTLELTFASRTPAIQVASQANAHFVTDPKGSPVDLVGSAGERI